MDLIIVGSSISSAVIANKFARKGKKVKIFERNNFLGGRLFDRPIEDTRVGSHGPFLFKTDNEKLKKYMDEFWTLSDKKITSKIEINGDIFDFPLNFFAIDKLWNTEAEEIKAKLLNLYKENQRVSYKDLLESNDEQINRTGEFILENIYKPYLKKVWGKDYDERNDFEHHDVEFIVGYDNRMYNKKYQGMPVEGYSKTIDKLLDHKNISVFKNTAYEDVLELVGDQFFHESLEVKCPIIFTKTLDQLFDYKFGALHYRAKKTIFETEPVREYQVAPIMLHYNKKHTYFRVTEYKKISSQPNQSSDVTTISYENIQDFDVNNKVFSIRSYALRDEVSVKRQKKYLAEVEYIKNLHVMGRLANFKNLDIDELIEEALELSDKLL